MHGGNYSGPVGMLLIVLFGAACFTDSRRLPPPPQPAASGSHAGTLPPSGGFVATRNPIMEGADPHAEVIGDRVWIYPTHRGTEFSRFYAYSSRDLARWDQHGPILDFADIPWIREDGQERHYAWAPAIAEKDGRFFFYYSVGPQRPGAPARIGVAVADSPAGPFEDSGRPLLTGGDGFEAIDPMVFKDPQLGETYFYAGGSAGATLRIFELNPDMVSFAREIPVETPPSFTEAPFVHYRHGRYYLSYSHGSWRHASYSVHYATSETPVGPWRYRGALLTSDERHKGPGHHSIFRHPHRDEWFIAYHRYNDHEGPGPYQAPRQIAIDRLEHDPGGTLAPIFMTDSLPTLDRAAGSSRSGDEPEMRSDVQPRTSLVAPCG